MRKALLTTIMLLALGTTAGAYNVKGIFVGQDKQDMQCVFEMQYVDEVQVIQETWDEIEEVIVPVNTNPDKNTYWETDTTSVYCHSENSEGNMFYIMWDYPQYDDESTFEEDYIWESTTYIDERGNIYEEESGIVSL